MSQRLFLWDLGTLTYSRPEPDQVIVSAPGVPELLIATVPTIASDREAVFVALDQVLSSARVPTVDGLIPVGLYNPLSADVAVGGTPYTTSYTDGEPLEIDEHGALVALDEHTLVLGDRALTPRTSSWVGAAAAMAAHR